MLLRRAAECVEKPECADDGGRMSEEGLAVRESERVDEVVQDMVGEVVVVV